MSHSKKKKYVLYSLSRVWEWGKVKGTIYTDIRKEYGWVPALFTREQLISKLAINFVHTKENRCIINNLSDDMSETYPECSIISFETVLGVMHNTDYNNKYYMMYEKKGKFIHLNYNEIKDEVEKRIAEIKIHKLNINKKLAYESRLGQFEFRRGPVPNICHYRYHRGTYYRIPKLKNVKTANNSCGDETKIFEKSKYRTKNLPVWDDRVRHNNKSWKTQYKVKKQWMIHLENHIDFDKPMEYTEKEEAV